MKNWILYCWFACSLQACETPAALLVNKEFENNCRSSSIDMHHLSSGKIELLGYRQLTDSVFATLQTDSFINMGLLFPGQTVRKETYSHTFLFGKETQQCFVYYSATVQSLLTKPPIIKPSGNVPAQQESNKLTGVQLGGTIQYPGSNTAFSFAYANYTGWLQVNNDSFKLTPVYDKNSKALQTLTGVQLLKQDTLFALVHSFTGLSKKKAFMYNKATAAEQLLIAAYIAVIARYL